MGDKLIALAIPGFFALIAVELVVAARRGRSVYRFNDSIADLSCGIGQQLLVPFMQAGLVAAYAAVHARWAVFDLPATSAWTWIVAFVGVDLCYYAWHRASHEVNFLWAVHVVHHQSEEYNLAVALRQAWFSGITSWPFYAPLAVVGVPPLVFVVSVSLSTLYQFWIHTRLVGKLGPLELFLNTPSHHRVHHGRDAKYLDRNHGATLIVWDRLFGSFQEEEEEPRYGTVDGYPSWNPVWANLEYWVKVRRQSAGWPLPAQLAVWLRPPGWTPSGAADPADDDSGRMRFDTPAARARDRYVLAQMGVLVTATTAYMFTMMDSSLASTSVRAGVALVLLASTLAFSGLLEGRTWARGFELARLAAFAAVASAVPASGALVAVCAGVALASAAILVLAVPSEQRSS